MNLRKLSDFDLISKLAENLDGLEEDLFSFYCDAEEMVQYNQRLGHGRREKIIKLIERNVDFSEDIG